MFDGRHWKPGLANVYQVAEIRRAFHAIPFRLRGLPRENELVSNLNQTNEYLNILCLQAHTN